MTSTDDLTRGPIRRQLISLALPLLACNIFQQLYNTLDVTIVGRCVGSTAFAAVGMAGSVMNLFLFLLTGICNGMGALFSQFHGAGDDGAFRREFFLAAVFGGGFAVALTLLAGAALGPLLGLLQTPEELLFPASAYLGVIFLGFLPAFAYQLGFSLLRSIGNTGAALLFLMLSMGSNLVLDIAFVAGLGWGVEGAAWATVLSQALAAVLCQAYLRFQVPHLVFRREDMRYDGLLLRQIAHFSLASALHMCNLYIGKLLIQGTVNHLGTDAINAFTAGTRIEGFANSFGDSAAASMAVFIGQNTGAGNGRRVRKGFFTGERLLVGLAAVMGALMIAGAVPALSLVLPKDSGAALTAAVGYLRIVALFYFFNFLGSGMVGYFQGRGMVNMPVIGSVGQMTFRIVVSILLAPHMGLSGVALATGLGWAGVCAGWGFFPARKSLRAIREDEE